MPAPKNYEGVDFTRPTSEIMEELNLSKSRVNALKAKAGVNSIKGRPKNKIKSINLPSDVVESLKSLAETLTAFYKKTNKDITINENIITHIILYHYFKNSKYSLRSDVMDSLMNNSKINIDFDVCAAYYALNDAISAENSAAAEARQRYRYNKP